MGLHQLVGTQPLPRPLVSRDPNKAWTEQFRASSNDRPLLWKVKDFSTLSSPPSSPDTVVVICNPLE